MFRAALVLVVLGVALNITGCSRKSETRTEASTTETGMGMSADETKRQASANDSLPTATDQGESEADRTITQTIRQAVVGNNALSMDARNVQIITANGVVTLRGAVKSDGEKTLIVQLAEQTPGVTRVDDMIEVNTGS